MTFTQNLTGWKLVIALDGGTTNTRARLIGAGGEIIATAVRAVGVRNTAVSGRRDDRAADLKHAVRQVILEAFQSAYDRGAVDTPVPCPDAIIASGMLSSEVGLCAIPHVMAPAGLDDLARAVKIVSLEEISECPIRFITGVRTSPGPGPEGWFCADVMRGEETETFGAISALMTSGVISANRGVSPPAFVWPGSHTKLVEIDGECRIVRSTTSLAGELTQAIWNHTLLAASLPPEWPKEIDREAAESGARAVEQSGLGRAAFLIRISAINDILDPVARASFWIGTVLADDAAFLARHPILADSPRRPVWIGGREPLRGLLAHFLRKHHPGEVNILDDETADLASPRGSCHIAGRSVTLDV